ncbi:peptidylprolyl isomerase [Sulfurimonas sp.]|uniref:peptidylprolyl isomerase n=1 Tax=Sulfurimonas sp. TaxID=2022749 RepID=UPI002605BA71|nr:peptidylprolyl isomerase [Sulfurimonas sp.]MCW8895583.1 peptidylprolyl isomerase [Sulfurimonas sp.]
MNKIFLIAVLGIFLYADKVLLPESTVAVVNGTAISIDERDKEVGKLLPKAYFHSTVNDKKLKDLQEKALESLIEKTLFYSYAISKNITTSESEIDDVMTKLAVTYGSKKNLENAIKKLGFTKETFREVVKKDETLKKLYKKEIKYDISEDELKDYYEKNMYKFKEPEKIRVRLIHVRNNPEDPEGKSKAKKRIDEAMAEIKKGTPFGDVAAKYSTAMSRIKGGDMGFLHRGRLDMAVEEVAFAMEIGQVSEIIEQDIGYFIVKVENKKKQNQLSFEKVKKGLKRDLKNKEEDKRKAALLEKLMATAVIIK